MLCFGIKRGDFALRIKLKSINPVAVFLLFFGCWLLWSVWQVFILPSLPNNWFTVFVDLFVAKSVIWVFPFLLFPGGIKRFLSSFKRPIPWLVCLSVICLTVAFLYTIRVLNGLQNSKVLFDPLIIAISVSAGVIEEISFRFGFFECAEESLGMIFAAILNGVAFTVYHYPWIIVGRRDGLISLRTLLIFIMGIVFCLMYKKWRSLLLVILVHTLWDIFSYLFCLAG